MRAALLKLLQAEALEGTGQHRHALRQVTELLEWATAGGYVRLLADEGKSIAKLLIEARPVDTEEDSNESRMAAFIDQVLKAMHYSDGNVSDSNGAVSSPELVEALSGREIQVLRMLERGYSNKLIGERLFISENTVKVHLRNVNSKLAVGNRTQAVSEARRLGLLT